MDEVVLVVAAWEGDVTATGGGDGDFIEATDFDAGVVGQRITPCTAEGVDFAANTAVGYEQGVATGKHRKDGTAGLGVTETTQTVTVGIQEKGVLELLTAYVIRVVACGHKYLLATGIEGAVDTAAHFGTGTVGHQQLTHLRPTIGEPAEVMEQKVVEGVRGQGVVVIDKVETAAAAGAASLQLVDEGTVGRW